VHVQSPSPGKICLTSCDGCCSSSNRSKDRPNCNCGKGGVYVAPRIEFYDPARVARGYGYHLVRGTLEEVRRLNLKLVPQCWFVREVIERRPEFQDLLR
jgi:hypothetical protein